MSNHGYSRRRPKSKGDIAPPTSRVQMDAVTGELVTTALDGVQLAFETVRRWYETAATAHRLSGPQRERLADLVLVMVMRTKRHRDRDVDALRALLATMGAAA